MPYQYDRSDLNWSLTSFSKPRQASHFFALLEGALPVYSGTVRKLYTDYHTEVVGEHNPVLVIQPDMAKYASMFHNIERESVVRTSVFIHYDATGLKLSAISKQSGNRQSYDLKTGFYHLFCGGFVDDAFLPVVTYGDLRPLPGSERPILQLHGLRTEALTNLGQFQVRDIVQTVKEHLIERLDGIV